ncbi:dynein regulatory complex protein 9-like [Tribolium madens]|uniref:dynein regulatory complex protein 9-like n=1 Tax=Tribolium madens TaxID=41895 RepID=UPI001CF72C4A|nr:dynein regulatory complex protein 9-like [Tribolium madens]
MGGSSKGSSSGSDSNPRQVQFGLTQDDESEESLDLDLASEHSEPEIDNVNERLRHQTHFPDEDFQIKSLSRVLAVVTTVMLQMCYQKIAFFRTINKMPRVPTNLEYVPLDEKYHNAEREIGVILHPSEEFLNYRKFQKDLSWLENVLKSVIIDLQKSFYFDDFIKILNEDNLTRQEEHTLLTSKMFNLHEVKKLRTYLDLEKKELNRELQDVTEELGNFKDQLNDDIIESGVKLNYLKEWQKSRQEQNTSILNRQEQKLIKMAENMNAEIEKEIVIHEDMFSFLEMSLSEFQEEITKWMEKYDVDMEELEKAVEKKKIDLEQQKDNYLKLLEEYNSRQEEMDKYKAHKLQMQREAEELQRQTRAATRIQAWWRGVMFRKGLGPFKRKKGKGKKGSGSGKKPKK